MAAASRATHTPSVWQLVLGIVSLSVALLTTFALAGISLAGRLSGESSAIDLQPVEALAWVTLAIGCTAIPSIVFAANRLSKGLASPGPQRFPLRSASIALLLLAPLAWLTTLPLMSSPTPFVKAAINILFVAVPAWWIVELGRHGLPRITRQKQWGLLNFGSFVTMPIVILVEILLLGVGLVILTGWLSRQPDFAPLLDQVKNLVVLNPQHIDLLAYQLEPLLKSPVVVGAVLLAFSLVVPLVEELFKPLALWIFINRRWSPTEGFIAGMLSGAAFAFVESIIALVADSSADWLTIAGARAVAALLHIATAGFSGWALTSSWVDGKYTRLALTYIGVVLVHGAWNFFAVSFGLSPFLDIAMFSPLQSLSSVAPWMMALLAFGLATILLALNAKLKKVRPISNTPPQLPPALPE